MHYRKNVHSLMQNLLINAKIVLPEYYIDRLNALHVRLETVHSSDLKIGVWSYEASYMTYIYDIHIWYQDLEIVSRKGKNVVLFFSSQSWEVLREKAKNCKNTFKFSNIRKRTIFFWILNYCLVGSYKLRKMCFKVVEPYSRTIFLITAMTGITSEKSCLI